MTKFNRHNELPFTPPVRGIRIKTAGDARRLLNRVINLLFKDSMKVETARVIIYATSVLLKAYEMQTLEALETEINSIKQHTGMEVEEK